MGLRQFSSGSQNRLNELHSEIKTAASLSMGRAFLIDKKVGTKDKDNNEHCLLEE